MRPHDDAGHLDFIALSAHKAYAPFGSGAMVGARDAFAGDPDQPGGGTVLAVTLDEVAWADLPDREEAGSPNVVGAVALATALATLTDIGRACVAVHEAELLRYATARLRRIPGLRLYGPTDRAALASRLGVIPFDLVGFDHGLVAAVLGYEHGIGVRSGCFCAHPYMAHLLGLDQRESDAWARRVARGDMREAPGVVRISVGCYNDEADIDRVALALEAVAAGDIAGTYSSDSHGEYRPRSYREPRLFSLTGALR
jgi:selenocysteine lyase/cysteine desulfurase